MVGSSQLSWYDLLKRFQERYDDRSKREVISARISALRFGDFRARADSDAAALDSLIAKLEHLAPMAATHDRDNEARCRTLIKACSRKHWALEAQTGALLPCDFQILRNALHSAIRALNDHGVSSHSGQRYGTADTLLADKEGSSASNDGSSSPEDGAQLNPTRLNGQRRFSRPQHRRWLSRPQNARGRPSRKFTSSSDFSRFNCGKKGFHVSSCREPRDEACIWDNLRAWREHKHLRRPMWFCSADDIANMGLDGPDLVEVFYCEQLIEGDSMPQTQRTSTPTLIPVLQTSHSISRSHRSPPPGRNPSPSKRISFASLTTEPDLDSDSLTFFAHWNASMLQPYSVNFYENNASHSSTSSPAVVLNFHIRDSRLQLYPGTHFLGFCIDTGASRNVVGLAQHRAYCKIYRADPTLQHSHFKFTFSTATYATCGVFGACLPVSVSVVLHFLTWIVREDVPFLLGIDASLRYGLAYDYGCRIMHYSQTS